MKRCVLLLLATVLLLSILVSCAQGNTKTEETQTSSLGLGWLSPVHEYDGWIYYTVYPEGIYKVRTNGKDRTLVSEKTPYWFEIYKDRIYYAVYKDGENYDNCIYSCKTDGSNVTFICENYFVAYKVFKFSIVDDWIYYFPKAFELRKVKTDGSEIVELNEKDEMISDFTIEDGWVYYTNEYVNSENGMHYFDLNGMRTDGMLRTKLITENCRDIEFKDDWIYYIHEKEKGVYKVKVDGTGKQKITDYAAGSYSGLFKVIGDWVYYEENSEGEGIYKVKTDGSEKFKLTGEIQDYSYIFNVWENWLVYIEPPITYPEEEHGVAHLIRLSSTYKTDAVIEQILEEIDPDLEIKKYEEFTPILNIVQEGEAQVALLPDDSWYSDFDLYSNNFVEYEGWIYYSEFGKSGYENLYRIRTDGTQKEKICDCTPYMVGISGGKLYVLTKGTEIFSMSIDGSYENKCNFGYGYLSLAIENDSLYMQSGLSIYATELENEKLKKLSLDNKGCTDFSVSGGWIYYTKHVFDEKWGQYLYKIKTDGTEKTKLTQDGCMAIDYDDEWIYYVEESGKSIYKMRMDGSENQKLTECNSARKCFFKVFGDWVYYENFGDDFGLYKVNTQTGKSMKVLETRMDAYVGMGGNWLINIYKDHSTIPSKTTYQMIRVGNTETTDDIIEMILEEMPEDIEILIVE